jgi:hypothetical protein
MFKIIYIIISSFEPREAPTKKRHRQGDVYQSCAKAQHSKWAIASRSPKKRENAAPDGALHF